VIAAGALEGASLIVSGESGSGKTLSYLLPIINELNKFKDQQEKALGVSGGDSHYHLTNKGFFKFSKDTED
jgi:ABC-type lipoprotein export system ATPase subunit